MKDHATTLVEAHHGRKLLGTQSLNNSHCGDMFVA